jgi:broad specificity phosphatase PhoE
LDSPDGAAEDRAVLTEPSDFCRLWLFRHPELDPSHQSRAVGSGDAPLGRRGRTQVLQWLAWLEGTPLSEVHCSPQPQCAEPARALAQPQKLEPRVDPRLRDQEMGRWQGREWSELVQEEGAAVRDFFAEFGDAGAPGGESLGSAVERALGWWTETAPRLLGRSIAVVLPGSVLSGFAAALLGMRLSRCVSLQLPHGGLGVLDAFANGVRIALWNAGALGAD